MNTDFTRQNSTHTKTLQSFCRSYNLEHIGLKFPTIDFTFESEMNNTRSLIDHFIISDILIEDVVK